MQLKKTPKLMEKINESTKKRKIKKKKLTILIQIDKIWLNRRMYKVKKRPHANDTKNKKYFV